MPIPNLFVPSLYVNYALRNPILFPFKITHLFPLCQKSFRGAYLVYVSKKCFPGKQWWHRKVETISKKKNQPFFLPIDFLKKKWFCSDLMTQIISFWFLRKSKVKKRERKKREREKKTLQSFFHPQTPLSLKNLVCPFLYKINLFFLVLI